MAVNDFNYEELYKNLKLEFDEHKGNYKYKIF